MRELNGTQKILVEPLDFLRKELRIFWIKDKRSGIINEKLLQEQVNYEEGSKEDCEEESKKQKLVTKMEIWPKAQSSK